jgi:uncharacterized surface protein with fasciclin (FAS1) repeats
MGTNVSKAAALLAAAVLSGQAAADDGRWPPRGAAEFFACAATPAVEFPGTIVDAALATPDLSTLADAVVAAGLVETLSGPGPFTVFAPTNAAFAKIPPAGLSMLVGDAGLLTAVLTYHVVPGSDRALDPRLVYSKVREVATVQGQTVFLNRHDGPQVNQSNVSCQPVKTTNGVVWIIDSVLLPQF